MSEKPILFSGPMVRAIMDRRKTQTRRVITNVKGIGKVAEIGPASSPPKFGYDWSIRSARSGLWHELSNKSLLARGPYQVGDVLWVRETWAPSFQGLDCIYKADNYQGPFAFNGPWKSPIFMPRWASRITLEIISVQAQRLQDSLVNDENLQAEGWPSTICHDGDMVEACFWFMDLWDSLNLKRGYGWESNPWVWVIEFKRLEGV